MHVQRSLVPSTPAVTQWKIEYSRTMADDNVEKDVMKEREQKMGSVVPFSEE